jgi:hypothetical protein
VSFPASRQLTGIFANSAQTGQSRKARLILGVIGPASDIPDPNDFYDRYLLEPWAVRAALRRCARRPPTEKQMAEMLDHLLGEVNIGDLAVVKRPHRLGLAKWCIPDPS